MTLSEVQQNTLRSSVISDFATNKSHFSWDRPYTGVVEGDQETHTLGFGLNLMIKCFTVTYVEMFVQGKMLWSELALQTGFLKLQGMAPLAYPLSKPSIG